MYSLINHDSLCWKEDEIDRCFILKEAALIKAIPLSLFNREDVPYWPHTRDGVFSVRSGCRLCLDLAEIEAANSTGAEDATAVWKAIWWL